MDSWGRFYSTLSLVLLAPFLLVRDVVDCLLVLEDDGGLLGGDFGFRGAGRAGEKTQADDKGENHMLVIN